MEAYEPPTFETLGSLTEMTLGKDDNRGRGHKYGHERHSGFSR